MRPPRLGDPLEVLRARAAPPSRRRSGRRAGCRGRRPETRRAGPRWKIRNISAVQRPIPFTSISSAITSSSGRSASRFRSSRPSSTRSARSRRNATLEFERPALRSCSGFRAAAPPGCGVAPSNWSSSFCPDRGGGLGRELLADDRPRQRLVGVGAAAAAVGLGVDRAPLLHQPRGAPCRPSSARGRRRSTSASRTSAAWAPAGLRAIAVNQRSGAAAYCESRTRPAESACRCRGRRRSTSSPGRSPCRSAPARGAAW